MENLTPQLNDQQIRVNIDALIKGGTPKDKIQEYVNNYSKGADGNYVLKTQTPQAPTTPVAPAKPSLIEQIGQEQLAGGQKIVSSIQEGASQIEKGINAKRPEDLLNIPAGIAKAGAGAV